MNRTWNPGTVAPPFAAYSLCSHIPNNSTLLTIAGQVGVMPDGTLAQGIEAQCEWALKNVLEVLQANGMRAQDLVKLGTYLTDRDQLAAYRRVRQTILGDHVVPPSTLVIVSGLADPAWLVEVEAYAARPPPEEKGTK